MHFSKFWSFILFNRDSFKHFLLICENGNVVLFSGKNPTVAVSRFFDTNEMNNNHVALDSRERALFVAL